MAQPTALWIYLALSAWLLIQIPTVAMHPRKPWKSCADSG